MRHLNDRFEEIALNEFKFLETHFHFKVHSVKKDNYGCFIVYKASVLAIRVSHEIYDGGVFVYFYKLKDGEIPEYPIFFDPKAEFLIFDFNNLMILRASKIIEQSSGRVYEEPEYMRSVVKSFATNVKTHATDILKGDFSVISKIQNIVVRRAKELENET